MDTFLHTCSVAVFIVILVSVHSGEDNTTVYIPDETINSARCLSNCFNLVSVMFIILCELGLDIIMMQTS